MTPERIHIHDKGVTAMRKGNVILIVALLVVTMVGTPALAQQIHLTHLFNPSHHEAHQRFVEKKAVEFQAIHPNVKIEVVVSPGNYVEKVLIASAGGVPYDIVEPTSAQISAFASQGILKDLNPYFERGDVNLGAFLPMALVPFDWDGELICLPSEVNAVTTVANVRLFEEAGLSTPQQLGSDWNWDTLVDISPKLSGDLTGVGVSNRWAVLLPHSFHRVLPALVHNAGGDVFDAQVQPGNSMFLKDPAVREGLQFYLDLYERNWLTTTAATFRSEETTAINMADGSWWIGLLKRFWINRCKGPLKIGNCDGE